MICFVSRIKERDSQPRHFSASLYFAGQHQVKESICRMDKFRRQSQQRSLGQH